MVFSKQKQQVTTASISPPMERTTYREDHPSLSSGSSFRSYRTVQPLPEMFGHYEGMLIDLTPGISKSKKPSTAKKLWDRALGKGDKPRAIEKQPRAMELDSKPYPFNGTYQKHHSRSTPDLLTSVGKKKHSKHSHRHIDHRPNVAVYDIGKLDANFAEIPADYIARHGLGPVEINNGPKLVPLRRSDVHDSTEPDSPWAPEFTPEVMGWGPLANGRQYISCAGMSPYSGQPYLHHPSPTGSFVSLSGTLDAEDIHAFRAGNGLIIPRRKM